MKAILLVRIWMCNAGCVVWRRRKRPVPTVTPIQILKVWCREHRAGPKVDPMKTSLIPVKYIADHIAHQASQDIEISDV